MFTNFLDPYDKVIFFRKKYKISQKELGGGFYSQAYMTKLETKKQEATLENMQFFACQFNKLFREKNIKDIICLKDLLESRDDTIDGFYKKKLHQLKEISNDDSDKLSRLENIVKDLDFHSNYLNNRQKFDLFREVSSKAFELEQYHTAKTYSFNFLLEAMLLKEHDVMQDGLILLTRACLHTKDYKYIFELQNLLEPFYENFKPHAKEIIYMNFSVISSRLENYPLALQYLEKIDEEIIIKKLEFKEQIHKAVIYRKLNDYINAKEIYVSLIKRKDRDKDILIWAKLNLLTILKKLNQYNEVKKTYSFLKKYVTDGKNIYLKKRYLTLAETALYLNRYTDAIHFLNKALSKLKENDLEEEDIQINYECLKILLSLYQKKDLTKVKKLENMYFELFKKYKNLEIGFSFVNFYNKNRFYEELNNFLTKQEHHFL